MNNLYEKQKIMDQYIDRVPQEGGPIPREFLEVLIDIRDILNEIAQEMAETNITNY